MEQNKEKKIEEDFNEDEWIPTQLEYLIRMRARNWSSKDWIYFTRKQKVGFMAIMISLEKFEQDKIKSVTISDLIKSAKTILDKNAEFWSKKYGVSVGKKYSEEVIRLIIYISVPLFIGIQQFQRPKYVRLTKIGRKFNEWTRKNWINPNGKKISNAERWLKKGKIEFVEK